MMRATIPKFKIGKDFNLNTGEKRKQCPGPHEATNRWPWRQRCRVPGGGHVCRGCDPLESSPFRQNSSGETPTPQKATTAKKSVSASHAAVRTDANVTRPEGVVYEHVLLTDIKNPVLALKLTVPCYNGGDV